LKSYHDIVGDGGSNIVQQVEAGREKIARALAHVRHRVAIGSGKGGVGKSTLTRALASVLAARGLEVAVLDADLNGPTQARMSGLAGAVPLPGPDGLGLPRARDGVRVFSIGEMLPETAALEFASVAQGDAHTWRATKEFALLGELLGSIAWGRLDVLLFDLPPGAERTAQFADFLGPETAFALVTIPSEISRGVVARSIAALSPTGVPIAGYVENMSGYLCPDCGDVKPLFPDAGEVRLDLPCLGRVPFDPALALACDRGTSFAELPPTAATRALTEVAERMIAFLETPR
jgi:ATP-binding protein involved in chromosome partitioning